MNAEPVFSIVTPTRNDLQKLRRCVGSVRGQKPVPLEHIVQDACSSDGTPEWLMQQHDLHVKTENDAGMYDAIQRGWSRARGKYLSWLNADEQYLPGTLEYIQNWFRANPSILVVFGDYIVVRSDGSAVALRKEIPFRRAYVVNGFLYSASCTLFFRRELWDQGKLRFDTALRYAADKDLLLRLNSDNINIAHVPRVLSIFGIDGTNLSMHPSMTSEAELVRRRHGACRSAMLRRLIRLGRAGERVLIGGYRSRDVSFRFAEDELPNYRDVTAIRLGGRYSLSDGIGNLSKVA